ncbi:MAG: YihY family inner membrane protein [Candidatus Sumerlaeia bacterium]|nr:YihY family inner membrane protein [Candidatus Sumerlaeia bacterium]
MPARDAPVNENHSILALLLRRLWRTARLTLHEFLGDRCFDKSASLAYVSLLGFFAVMTVVLSVSSWVFGGKTQWIEEHIEPLLIRLIIPSDDPSLSLLGSHASPEPMRAFVSTGQSSQEIVLAPVAATGAGSASAEMRDAVSVSIAHISDQLMSLTTQFRERAPSLGVFGLLGFVVLSMMLFTSIEKSFNEVCHVRRKRPLTRAFPIYVTVLVLGPVLIGVSVAFTLRLGSVLSWLSPGTAALAVTCVVFTLAYWLIPNTRISLVHAFIGGLVAGAMWELAKRGFILYVRSVPNVQESLVILGVVPIFLVWLFTSWTMVFIGLELCYVLQHYSPLAARLFTPDVALEMNPRHLATVLHEMASRFDRGRPRTTVADLMRATQLDEFAVHALLDHCEERGWIEASESHSSYHLARPPEQIALRDVLLSPVTHVTGDEPAEDLTPLGQFWRRYHTASEEALPAQTLRDLLRPAAPTPLAPPRAERRPHAP